MDKLFQCMWMSPEAQPSSRKQKVVLKLPMEDLKKRAKVMKSVVGWHGVSSVSLEGEDGNKIAVVGERIDAIAVTQKLRKRIGPVEVVSVAAVEEKKEEKKEEKETKPENVPPFIWSQPVVYEYKDPYYDTCSIL